MNEPVITTSCDSQHCKVCNGRKGWDAPGGYVMCKGCGGTGTLIAPTEPFFTDEERYFLSGDQWTPEQIENPNTSKIAHDVWRKLYKLVREQDWNNL